MTRVAWTTLLAWLVVATVGALVASRYPLAAQVGGVMKFPAFSDWLGLDPAPPPNDASTWRMWAASDHATADWALLAPIPFGPHETFPDRLSAAPSSLHLFGTDDTGRDVLSRVVHGASTAFLTALVVVVMAGLVGVTLGAVAGLFGGFADFAVLRTIELFSCFPALLMVLCVAAFIDGSAIAIMVVLASLYWTSFARIVRGELLSLREREWVLVADRGMRVGKTRLWFRHVLPEVRGQIAVVAAFVAANSIVAESTLRFLGLSGTGGVVSWGGLVAQFRSAGSSAWHVWMFPSLALIGIVLALHGVASSNSVAARRPRDEVSFR